MPQWDFLNFLTNNAGQFPAFDLRMQHEATDLLQENGRIIGAVVQTPEGAKEITADLVVACDGRHSIIRKAAELPTLSSAFREGGRRTPEAPARTLLTVIDKNPAAVLSALNPSAFAATVNPSKPRSAHASRRRKRRVSRGVATRKTYSAESGKKSQSEGPLVRGNAGSDC